MNLIVYYTLFVVLSIILCLEVLYLIFIIVADVCCPKPKRCSKVKSDAYNVFTQPLNNDFQFLESSVPNKDYSMNTLLTMGSFVSQKTISNANKLPDNFNIEFNAGRRTTIHVPDEVKDTSDSDDNVVQSKSHDELGVRDIDEFAVDERRLY